MKKILQGRWPQLVSNYINTSPGSHCSVNQYSVPWDKSDVCSFSLKPSLSCPATGTEGPPPNPPNPEVIAAGSFPARLTPASQTPKWRVYVCNIQIAGSLLLVAWCWLDGIKNNNFICVTAQQFQEARNLERMSGMQRCRANCRSRPRRVWQQYWRFVMWRLQKWSKESDRTRCTWSSLCTWIWNWCLLKHFNWIFFPRTNSFDCGAKVLLNISQELIKCASFLFYYILSKENLLGTRVV